MPAPKCLVDGTSIVVGGPLNPGILAVRDTWNYRPAPSTIVERVTAIAGICDAHRVPLAAAGLQFPLAHPAVAAIIPGPRNAAEFNANLELLRHPIPPALLGGFAAGRPAPSRSARPAPGITIYDSREPSVGRPRRCRSGNHISVVTMGATLTRLDDLSMPSRLA
jgi:hypothetical protein